MIRTIIASSILAISLSACAENDKRPIKHPDNGRGYSNHDHNRHLRQYNGYPYDRDYNRSGITTGVGIGAGSHSGVSTGVGVSKGSRSGVSTGIGFGFGL